MNCKEVLQIPSLLNMSVIFLLYVKRNSIMEPTFIYKELFNGFQIRFYCLELELTL